MPVLTRPDGVRLNYELHGEDGTPPLILLEGLGGDIPGWRRNIPVLASELRVVAYDFRGNGNSDEPPGPCTMETFVDDTVALLDELGIDRVHVYGQSFGGMVAQVMGSTVPERVRTLILACTDMGPRRAIPPTARTPKAEPWRALYAPGFPDTHPDHVAEDLRIGAAQPKHPVGGRRQWEAMEDFDSYDLLPGLTVPALVLHGTEDQLIPVESGRRLAERIPDAELVLLEGAGHLYHSEQAEAADAAVLDFGRRHADA
ncbi:MAG TPA: alpha/beta hydrolase [Actinomycetota bacterium]|nr:alpha/beta hydrolase [Actinomycetota bacterium]